MTPAVRILKAAQVAFALHSYEHDARANSFGLEAAEKLGVPLERVFKTLVAQLDGKELLLAVVPVTARLDFKKLATALGGKKAGLADPARAERATAVQGPPGCGPAHPSPLPPRPNELPLRMAAAPNSSRMASTVLSRVCRR